MSVYVFIPYTHPHTCRHTLHTYIHTHIHIWQADVVKLVNSVATIVYMYVCVCVYSIHTPTHMYTYTKSYIHTYIHTYIHIWQADVVKLVNSVATIVHRVVTENHGAPNKNIGDAFLVCVCVCMYVCICMYV